MPRACPEPALSNVEGPALSNVEGPSRRACPEPSRRGGKRPGAGAPKGNLNALKHGGHSAQVRQLAVTLALLPSVRDTFIRFARRQRRQRRTAAKAGHHLLTHLLHACLAGLENNQPKCPTPQSGHASKSQIPPEHNQKLNLGPEVNQTFPQPGPVLSGPEGPRSYSLSRGAKRRSLRNGPTRARWS